MRSAHTFAYLESVQAGGKVAVGCLNSLMLSKVNLDIVYIIRRHFVIFEGARVALAPMVCSPYHPRECCPSY